ncbi:hypothetical protein AAY473_022421 [Plecturocebus cupreus]
MGKAPAAILNHEVGNHVLRPDAPVIPALWEAKVGRLLESKSSRPAWTTWWADHLRSGVRELPRQDGESPISTKNTKNIWAWWCIPVVPATQEAEAGELLEPGSGDCNGVSLITRLEAVARSLLTQLPFRLKHSPASASRVAGTTGTHHHVRYFCTLVETGFHRVGQDDGVLLLLPKLEGNVETGFTMLTRLVLNSSPQVIHLPWPPKVLGLQA